MIGMAGMAAAFTSALRAGFVHRHGHPVGGIQRGLADLAACADHPIHSPIARVDPGRRDEMHDDPDRLHMPRLGSQLVAGLRRAAAIRLGVLDDGRESIRASGGSWPPTGRGIPAAEAIARLRDGEKPRQIAGRLRQWALLRRQPATTRPARWSTLRSNERASSDFDPRHGVLMRSRRASVRYHRSTVVPLWLVPRRRARQQRPS